VEESKGVALVTGAGRGIGRAIALELARRGYDIALNDINQQDLEKVKEEISSQGKKSDFFVADVSDSAATEEMIKNILSRLGRIDVLVNNAGITRDNLLLRMKEAEWDQVMQVNLKSVFNCTRAVSKVMLKQKCGRIVSIASVIGIMGNAGQANYAASKAGIIGFTKSIAKELASRGITVNAVAPGYIITEMTEKLPEESKNKLREMIPLGTLGEPADVAKTVAFLASDDAHYITGQVIQVDGGMVM
jgi:3-oxoacyl-[acyl-carrier protein] reductase